MQFLCRDERIVLMRVYYHRIFFPCLHCKLDTERSLSCPGNFVNKTIPGKKLLYSVLISFKCLFEKVRFHYALE